MAEKMMRSVEVPLGGQPEYPKEVPASEKSKRIAEDSETGAKALEAVAAAVQKAMDSLPSPGTHPRLPSVRSRLGFVAGMIETELEEFLRD